MLAPSLTLNPFPNLSVKIKYQGYRNDATPQIFLRPQMELETPASMVASLYNPGYPGFSQLLNAKTNQPYALDSDPCVERGPQVAYNAAAHQATVKAVKAFLIERFDLKG